MVFFAAERRWLRLGIVGKTEFRTYILTNYLSFLYLRVLFLKIILNNISNRDVRILK